MAKRDYTKLTKGERAWIEETGQTVYKGQGGVLLVKEACSRCGGTGKHSWCEAYLDRCFKCEGTTYQLSKVANAHRRHRRAVLDRQKREAAEAEFSAIADRFIPVCDLIHSGQAVIDQRRKDAEAARLAAQSYVGTVGETIELPVTIERIIAIEGGWYGGGSWLHIMKDADGNKLIWFTGGEGLHDYAGYDLPVTIRASVKAQEVYEARNEKQTKLQRVRVTKKADKAYRELLDAKLEEDSAEALAEAV